MNTFISSYNNIMCFFSHNFFSKCATFAFALRFPWSVRPFLGLLTPALKSENLRARSDFVSSRQACLYIPARLLPSAFRNPSPILLGAEKPFCWQLLNINDACARNGAPAQNNTHAGFPDYTLYAVTFLPCICSLFCFFFLLLEAHAGSKRLWFRICRVRMHGCKAPLFSCAPYISPALFFLSDTCHKTYTLSTKRLNL